MRSNNKHDNQHDGNHRGTFLPGASAWRRMQSWRVQDSRLLCQRFLLLRPQRARWLSVLFGRLLCRSLHREYDNNRSIQYKHCANHHAQHANYNHKCRFMSWTAARSVLRVRLVPLRRSMCCQRVLHGPSQAGLQPLRSWYNCGPLCQCHLYGRYNNNSRNHVRAHVRWRNARRALLKRRVPAGGVLRQRRVLHWPSRRGWSGLLDWNVLWRGLWGCHIHIHIDHNYCLHDARAVLPSAAAGPALRHRRLPCDWRVRQWRVLCGSGATGQHVLHRHRNRVWSLPRRHMRETGCDHVQFHDIHSDAAINNGDIHIHIHDYHASVLDEPRANQRHGLQQYQHDRCSH